MKTPRPWIISTARRRNPRRPWAASWSRSAVSGAGLLWAIPDNPLVWLAWPRSGRLAGSGSPTITSRWCSAAPAVWRRAPCATAVAGYMGGGGFWRHVYPAYDPRPRPSTGWLPFCKAPVLADMGGLAAFVFAALVIIGFSNAVNLTDGLDASGYYRMRRLGHAGLPGAGICGRTYPVCGIFAGAVYRGSGRTGGFLRMLAGALGVFVVQLPPGAGFHGGHGQSGAGRRAGSRGGLDCYELALLVIGGCSSWRWPA